MTALPRILLLAAALTLSGAGTARALAIETVTSPGGITAWLVEDHALPVVSVELGFRGGSASDPSGKAGLAEFTTDLLDEGAGPYDATQFKGRLEDLAATLAIGVDPDMAQLDLRTLAANLPDALDLVRLALAEPRFSDDAVARVRGQLLAALERRARDPNYIADRLWWETEMVGHPYARPRQGTPATIARIGPDDMRGFVRARFARDIMLVGVVGDITPAQLAPLLDRAFGGLPAKAAPSGVPSAHPRDTADLLLATMPIPQSVVVFGQPGITRDDPDWYAALLVTHILGGGGGLTSRLALEVREKRGLAYSVYCGLAPLQHGGVIVGGVATENARLAQSIDLIRAEWRRMRDQGPTANELAAAKTYLTGSFPLNFDSTARVASLLVVIQRDQLGADYLDRRNALINAVTLDQARRVAKKILDPGALVFAVVGSPANLKGARSVGLEVD